MTSPSSLTDGIRNAILYQLSNIHTAFPGKIISYDYVQKRASIQPQINKRYSDGDVGIMPILTSVPVIFPYASGASITFPVNPGDFCFVICCERSIDQWITSGEQGTPLDNRKFDLSDGVAIMGLLPFTETSPATNNTDFMITYKGSQIIIQESGNIILNTSATVSIGNSTTELLNILYQTLGYLNANSGGTFLNSGQYLALQTSLGEITAGV